MIKVGVAYESDPAQVRDVLTGIARPTSGRQAPAARGLFRRLRETGLEFELRCVVGDIEKALSVKSDINHAILQKFREAAIGNKAIK